MCSLHQSGKLCYEKSFHFMENFNIAKSGFIPTWNETQVSTFSMKGKTLGVTVFLSNCWKPSVFHPRASHVTGMTGTSELENHSISYFSWEAARLRAGEVSSLFLSSLHADLWRAWCCSPSSALPLMCELVQSAASVCFMALDF